MVRSLIADAGASNIQWAYVTADQTVRHQSKGFNPHYKPLKLLQQIIRDELPEHFPVLQPERIIYYGAGCSHKSSCAPIHDLFWEEFPGIQVRIEHDLLGSCHALFGDGNGLACILGTGSNFCLYENGSITYQPLSLGYLLGDEGSGTYLGKQLLKSILGSPSTEEPLRQSLFSRLQMDAEAIIQRIYRESHPNRFFASLTYFMSDHLGHPQIQHLISSAFADFQTHIITEIPGAISYPVGVVGSVGFVFRDIFKEVFNGWDISDSRILASPMDKLISYWRSHS